MARCTSASSRIPPNLPIKDDELQRLQEKLREESLKDTASQASEKDLKKLAKIIGKLGGRTAEVDVEAEFDADGEKASRAVERVAASTDDSHQPLVPTKLEFGPHTLSVTQGGTKKRLMVNLDAKNGYLYDDADLTITVEGPVGETKEVYLMTRAQLVAGRPAGRGRNRGRGTGRVQAHGTAEGP